MQIDEIRNMEDDALLDELEDRKKELFDLRFQKMIGQLSDPNLMRFNKRIIARIKTVLRERHLARELAATEGESNHAE
jgi:large subunit ribosomal protein L29